MAAACLQLVRLLVAYVNFTDSNAVVTSVRRSRVVAVERREFDIFVQVTVYPRTLRR